MKFIRTDNYSFFLLFHFCLKNKYVHLRNNTKHKKHIPQKQPNCYGNTQERKLLMPVSLLQLTKPNTIAHLLCLIIRRTHETNVAEIIHTKVHRQVQFQKRRPKYTYRFPITQRNRASSHHLHMTSRIIILPILIHTIQST